MRDERELSELVLAGAKLLQETRKRRRRNLTIAAAGGFALAVIIPYLALGGMSYHGDKLSASADTRIIGDATVGGYVFAALCGLIIGVTITLICQNIAARHEKDTTN
jgi:hypothetical protein